TARARSRPAGAGPRAAATRAGPRPLTAGARAGARAADPAEPVAPADPAGSRGDGRGARGGAGRPGGRPSPPLLTRLVAAVLHRAVRRRPVLDTPQPPRHAEPGGLDPPGRGLLAAEPLPR